MVADNINPTIHSRTSERIPTAKEQDELEIDEFDSREIFDMIRDINDPEHPNSLEELNVVQLDNISVSNEKNRVHVQFTPTIPHCSMATLIGLSIRVQLMRCLPKRFKVSVSIAPGTHASETAINKQLADKERVSAALENSALIEVVNQTLTPMH